MDDTIKPHTIRMNHTKKDGSVNWKDDDEIVVQLAGTFAADRFIVIKNKSFS